jgi:AraC family transcriptional regulator
MDPTLTTTQDYERRLLRVLIHIQKHLDDELELAALAAIAHFSPFHFHRVFSGVVGEGVKEHIRRLRLERAAHRLKFGDEQIIRLALDAGYEAHESFTRAFGAMFGESPSQFRARHRAVEYPPVPSGVHYAPDADGIRLAPPRRPDMKVTVERIPAKRVAFVRHTGPYTGVGAAWGALMSWAGRKGLLGPRMESFGLCHDDPDVTPPDKIRYDACLVVGPQVAPEGPVGVQDVAGGEFATAVHEGSFQMLGRTYAALCGAWAASSGRTLGDPPSMEYYLNDPRSTPEDQLRTKVCVRLA